MEIGIFQSERSHFLSRLFRFFRRGRRGSLAPGGCGISARIVIVVDDFGRKSAAKSDLIYRHPGAEALSTSLLFAPVSKSYKRSEPPDS